MLLLTQRTGACAPVQQHLFSVPGDYSCESISSGGVAFEQTASYALGLTEIARVRASLTRSGRRIDCRSRGLAVVSQVWSLTARQEGAQEGGVWEGCRGQRFGPRQAISSRNAILKISRTPRRWDASPGGRLERGGGEHM